MKIDSRPDSAWDETLAIRELLPGQIEWMLRSTLVATDHGMLLTDLDMQIIAVNRRFGEIFGINPKEALSLGMEPLRSTLRYQVVNPDAWMAATNAIYREPERIYQDVIELYRNRRIVIQRYSAPVRDSDKIIIGRLWTYREITREHRLSERNAYFQELSQAYDPDPEVVLSRILGVASRYYDHSNAILSLRRGEQMDFRMVVGPDSTLRNTRRIAFGDSYCQFALSSERPIIIQDAKLETDYCRMNAAASGLTRYLGVPIFDSSSGPIGTVCIVDGKSNQQLDDLDIEFMSVLAIRVSAELAREQHIREQLATKERQIEKQRSDLEATNALLESMNRTFSLLTDASDTERLVREQTKMLVGLLGYTSAAILVRRDGDKKYHGFVRPEGRKRNLRFSILAEELDMVKPGTVTQCPGLTALRSHLSTKSLLIAKRNEPGVGDVGIMLGRLDEDPFDDRHRIHIDAMVDHICLLLATQVLQAQLIKTNGELAQTQNELLQREKLSAVGTLAASTAHDIRNITASLGLLATPGLTSAEETLEAILEQLGRFDVLAHRLLSYAKPRMVAKEPVQIQNVLASVISLTSTQAQIANVEIRSQCPQVLPAIIGDRHQFEHLFVNLLLNGIQSMNRNGGTLIVRSESKTDMIRIFVSDTGPGIPKEIHRKLFEPFSSSRSDGFGLGLFSCRRIVEAHGGTIAARSNPAQGTTFVISLPTVGENSR